MRQAILKKTAGFLAMMLVVSMLVPVLAFASGFDVSYSSSGSVTGSVYFDGTVGDNVYGSGDTVTVNVYDSSDNFVTSTTATYSSYTGGAYHYSLDTVTGLTYDPIILKWSNGTDTVTSTVYKQAAPPSNGGGGGGYFPPTAIDVDTNGHISETALANLLQNNPNAELNISGDFVILPASALTEGESLKIVGDHASYTLPLSVLHLEDLAKELGVDLADLSIKVTLSDVTGDTATAIGNAAAQLGATQIGTAIDFNVTAVDKDGKVLKTFTTFDSYVSRSITLDQTVDSSNTTGVLYDPSTGEFSFVPSTFEDNNGKTIATLKRNGNSIYTVVQLSKSFNDISNSWAKDTIQLLANKLVVYGENGATFAPEANITRAEFASLIVNALGLNEDAAAAAKFSDVASTYWGVGVIGAASKAGIIFGDGNGTFRPDDNITREELASMMNEALKFAGQENSLTAAEQTQALAQFTDSNSITWGKEEVAALTDAGIIFGYPNNTYRPAANATRAESAEMLKAFLTHVGFIN